MDPRARARTSSFPTSRRSSCDRCRQLKLGCPPRPSVHDPCSRCTRANVNCSTGYTKPLGPSHGANVAKGNHDGPAPVNILEQRTPEASLSTEASAPPRNRMLECNPVSSGPECATALPSTDQSVEARLGPEVWLAAGENFGYDTIQTLLYSPSDPQAATFSNPLLDSGLTSVSDSSGDFCHLATPSATGTSYSVEHPTSPESGSQAGQYRSNDVPMDAGQRSSSLLGINGEAAVQQAFSNSQHQASEAGWDLRLSWLEVQLCQQVNDMTSSDIGAALFSTSEFLAILQSVHSSSASMMTEPSPAPPLTLETVLSLVTSFLRLIAIFDRLLLKLLRKVDRYNEVDDSGPAGGGRALLDPQTFQGFAVAGFPVQESSLQVKLLKQMIVHQFEMVEKILGLPVELRISDRRDAYPSGLLCDSEFGQCLLRLLTQQLNSSSTTRDTDTILSPYCRTDNAIHSSALASLRGSLNSLEDPYDTIAK